MSCSDCFRLFICLEDTKKKMEEKTHNDVVESLNHCRNVKHKLFIYTILPRKKVTSDFDCWMRREMWTLVSSYDNTEIVSVEFDENKKPEHYDKFDTSTQ